MKNELEQVAYKDIRIIPLSYLVQATDKGGNLAMMVVTPNSMTAVTAMDMEIPKK